MVKGYFYAGCNRLELQAFQKWRTLACYMLCEQKDDILYFLISWRTIVDVFNRLRSMDILLIDDDEWIRDSLSLFFENEGCHLKTLENAEEALIVIERKPA